MFDPFCRWKRIQFLGMNTTVGQLNFFEWAIQEEVLDFLQEHLEEVQKDMDDCSTTIQPQEGRKKRHELSRSATKSICMHDVRVPVKFD
jgi:pyrroloquinoline quinone (PQQ) biosynthesis protein C